MMLIPSPAPTMAPFSLLNAYGEGLPYRAFFQRAIKDRLFEVEMALKVME